MRSAWYCALVAGASTFALDQTASAAGAEPAPSVLPADRVCGNFRDFVSTDCPLSWYGITIYGTYDIGLGWVSHGLPENGYNYEGESLVNRNGNHSQFLIAPNNLSQTGLGIKIKEEFMPGLVRRGQRLHRHQSAVRPARQYGGHQHHQHRPAPGQLFVSPATARARVRPFNDELYGGVSSAHFGTLTFGRQRALGTDAMLLYDPASGAYAFSFIGYNGLMAGGGDTQDTRWDDAVKYRLSLWSGPFRRDVQVRRRLRAAATPPPPPGVPPPVRPGGRITRPMASISADSYDNSPPTSSSSV